MDVLNQLYSRAVSDDMLGCAVGGEMMPMQSLAPRRYYITRHSLSSLSEVGLICFRGERTTFLPHPGKLLSP